MRLEEEIRQSEFADEYHKLVVNILYTHGWLVTLLSSVLKKHDLTLAQFNILRILRGQHPAPATVTLLRERMLDKMSDASRLVERLRAKGLAERASDPGDRRRVAVCITEEGLAVLDSIGNFEDVMDEVIDRLPKDQARQVNDALDALRG